MSYFVELAALLREQGVPADHAEATLADLRAHLEESGGADPEAEFGPAAEFARELVPAGGGRSPRSPARTSRRGGGPPTRTSTRSC